jgi:hypothetical protein
VVAPLNALRTASIGSALGVKRGQTAMAAVLDRDADTDDKDGGASQGGARGTRA